MQVGGYDGVQCGGMVDYVCGSGVDQFFVLFYVWEFFGNLYCDFVLYYYCVVLGIVFGDYC